MKGTFVPIKAFSYKNTVMIHLSASLNCLRQLSVLRTSKRVAVVLEKDLSHGENNIRIQQLPWSCPIKKLDKSLVLCTLLSIYIEAFKEMLCLSLNGWLLLGHFYIIPDLNTLIFISVQFYPVPVCHQ